MGLSFASRTTQEALISSQEEDTTRVFNAAETAAEEALSKLSKGQAVSDTATKVSGLPDGINAVYSVSSDATITGTITEGASSSIVVDGMAQSAEIAINWDKTTDCGSRASLIISVFYNSSGTIKVNHTAVKPPGCYSDANQAVGFTSATAGLSTYKSSYILRFKDNMGLGDTPKIVRIKALYADADVNIVGGFSPQQDTIKAEATGATENGSNQRRAIEVVRTKPAPPGFLDYSLYSGGSLK